MRTAAVASLALSSPILLVLGLLALAAWRDRRREVRAAWQIRLFDAIADELGAIVAPVVTNPVRGPWRIEITVPVDRPATVGRIVGIVHETLAEAGAGRYELVLTPGAVSRPPLEGVTRPPRRLRAA